MVNGTGARKVNGGVRLGRRRWSFGRCVFDEANWSLSVDGRRMRVEGKPLELLRALLERAGTVVPKEDLLAAIWPGVTVVEASLPTAVHKLRSVLGEGGGAIVETVPGIGYRLAVPVEVEELAPEGLSSAAPAATHWAASSWARVAAATLAIALVVVTASAWQARTRTAQPVSQREAMNALRRLDVPEAERLLAAGWNPNAIVNTDGNAALHSLLEMCEWDPGHDQRKLMLMVRTLYEGGARVDLRNKWGDTPYSIASARRYCGPDHPATRVLFEACLDAEHRIMDKCIATYQIARRKRSEDLTSTAKSR